MKLHKLAAAFTLLLSTSVYAAPSQYIEFGIGGGGIKTPDIKMMSTDKHYANHVGGWATMLATGFFQDTSVPKLQLGGEFSVAKYESNRHHIDAHSLKYSGYNFGVSGLAKYNFYRNWNLLAKAGVAFVNQKTSSTTAGLNSRENQIRPRVGLGLGYDVNKNVTITASVDHVFGHDLPAFTSDVSAVNSHAYKKIADIDTAYLGVRYQF